LRVCYFVAPSLTRGWACNLLLLVVLTSAVPKDSRPYFIVPILGTPATWRAKSLYLYPPGTGWTRYTPEHWVPFLSLLTTCRATVDVPFLGGYKNGDLALQAGGVSYKTVKYGLSSVELQPKSDYSGKAQKQLYK
jgi:hypothetical protein